jgi:hypothetical protein
MKIERWAYLLIIAALIVLLFMKSCGDKPCPTCPECPPTVVKKDTFYKPLPVRYSDGSSETTRPLQPSLSETPPTPKEDYYLMPETGTKKYRDSIPFQDSAGYAIIDDDVEGEIVSRTFTYILNKKISSNQPIAKPAPQKGALYFGLNAVGNVKDPVGFVGLSFAWEPKSRKNIYSAGVGSLNGKLYYSGSVYFKIK